MQDVHPVMCIRSCGPFYELLRVRLLHILVVVFVRIVTYDLDGRDEILIVTVGHDAVLLLVATVHQAEAEVQASLLHRSALLWCMGVAAYASDCGR